MRISLLFSSSSCFTKSKWCNKPLGIFEKTPFSLCCNSSSQPSSMPRLIIYALQSRHQCTYKQFVCHLHSQSTIVSSSTPATNPELDSKQCPPKQQPTTSTESISNNLADQTMKALHWYRPRIQTRTQDASTMSREPWGWAWTTIRIPVIDLGR